MTRTQDILESMKKNAEENGYYLCPDAQLLHDLIDGLAVNTERYGYGSCPCRVASGEKIADGDIICPCEYRDADVDEYGMCYCGLFVNETIKNNQPHLGPIPERRPQEIQNTAFTTSEKKGTLSGKTIPVKAGKPIKKIMVWRCTVCGYLCARDNPPPLCPICKAKAERFEPFTFS